MNMYEEAMAYFVRASYIQPKEKKWKLMVASCHRRVGASQQALQVAPLHATPSASAVLTPVPPPATGVRGGGEGVPRRPGVSHLPSGAAAVARAAPDADTPLLQRICSDLGMMERASRYSELLAKAERKVDKQRAEALGAGGSAFASADQEADSVSGGDGGFMGMQVVCSDIARARCAADVTLGKARSSVAAGAQAKGFDNRKVSVTGPPLLVARVVRNHAECACCQLWRRPLARAG